MLSVLVIRLRSLRLLMVSGIVIRLRMFLLLITFLKASHSFFFFFNDMATTEIYTLSLHDALPIQATLIGPATWRGCVHDAPPSVDVTKPRSEEHTSELQSRQYLVCRLLLEKK